MIPERFTIQRGSGPAHPALHPDKRDALYKLLAEQKTKGKSKKQPAPDAKPGAAQGIDKVIYRMHDPTYSYFGRPQNG